MRYIIYKEFRAFFYSPTGYVVLAVFLLMTGLFTWVFPQTSIPDGGFASLEALFGIAPYLFMFLVPAITMRTFAEEKRAGTLELLFTRPITDLGVITGKQLACWLLAVFALLPTWTYYFSVYQLGLPEGNIDTAAVVGSYVGLLLLSALFTSIGVLASSLTDSQMVAFLLSVALCYLLYDGFALIASVNLWSAYAYPLSRMGIDEHYRSLSRGVLDSRNLLYFFSLIAFATGATWLVLRSRKW